MEIQAKRVFPGGDSAVSENHVNDEVGVVGFETEPLPIVENVVLPGATDVTAFVARNPR
jgi:hypothetical protein